MMNPMIAGQGTVSQRSQFVGLRLRKGPLPSNTLHDLRGTMLLPVKLLFILVLGFCVAHTLNDLLARFTDLDLRDRLEKRLDDRESRR